MAEMNLGHAHKTWFWFFLRVFSKFSDEHPRHFYRGVLPPPPGGCYSNYKAVPYDLVKQQIVEVASSVQYSSVQYNPLSSSHVICGMRYGRNSFAFERMHGYNNKLVEKILSANGILPGTVQLAA